MGTHYAPSQDPETLLDWANKSADAIIRELDCHVVLCYGGLSGTSMATALMLALHMKKYKHPVGMAYVRKPDEKSHGREVESNNIPRDPNVLCAWIFVDEQICSGDTFKRVNKGLVEHLMDISLSHWRNAEPSAAEKKKAVLVNCNLTHQILNYAELSERYVDSDGYLASKPRWGAVPQRVKKAVKKKLTLKKPVKAETVVRKSRHAKK